MGKKGEHGMKKFLMVATVPSMIGQFNMDNLHLLLNLGYEVHVACNFKDTSVWTSERIDLFKEQLLEFGIRYIQIEFARNPYDMVRLVKSYKELRSLLMQEQYKGLHCHTPVAGMIARLAAHGTKTKVIYTAHGFHFYKGAPLKNWCIYYPVEKICSYMTDILITINKEDFAFAERKMKAKSILYVPGVGVECKKFRNSPTDRRTKRLELGIKESDFIVISVGELNKNKNHETIVRAIASLKKDSIHYFIAGQGSERDNLISLAKSLNVNLHLLGYRTDIAELLNCADIYAFPSYREGLSVALMEAMASGLPCVVSKIRGNTDLVSSQKNGYLCGADNVEAFANAIKQLYEDKSLITAMKKENRKAAREYDIRAVSAMMSEIYKE